MEIKTVVSRDELNALREVLSDYNLNNPNIHMKDWIKGKIEFNVNWSAWGSQKPEVALEYAQQLIRSATVAKTLGALNITVDRSLPEIETEEIWNSTKQMWLDIIEKA